MPSPESRPCIRAEATASLHSGTAGWASYTGTASMTAMGPRHATMRDSLKPASLNSTFHCAGVRSRPSTSTCSDASDSYDLCPIPEPRSRPSTSTCSYASASYNHPSISCALHTLRHQRTAPCDARQPEARAAAQGAAE